MNTPHEPALPLAIASVEAGVTTQPHKLVGIAERHIVRSGCGLVEVDGECWQLRAGDLVIVDAGATQRITNNGSEDLEFYCICTPIFQPQNYVSLEE